MALTASAMPGDDGLYTMSGVARGDQTVTARLGRRYFHEGATWIGFDDNFAEPVIVRAYYDPAVDPEAAEYLTQREGDGAKWIGFMQFMQLACNYIPIPPQLYGGNLADRQGYVYDRTERFIDIMRPEMAALRNVQAPFYAYNALLTDGTPVQEGDFCAVGLVNGSLYSPADYGPNQSTVASLAAEIAPGLATEPNVTRLVNVRNLLTELVPSGAAPDTREAYRIALDWLKANPLPGSAAGTSPWLDGLDESAVAAQMIGKYVLLTLPDPENLGDTLVIFTWPLPDGRESIRVHVLDPYDMAGMVASAGRDMLERVRVYLARGGWTIRRGAAPPVEGQRGLKHLTTPPFLLPPDQFVLQLTYWAIPVGYREGGPVTSRRRPRWRQFTGLTWKALFQFSEDTGLVTFAAIEKPEPVSNFDHMEPINWYQKALRARPRSVDVSNFTKAAMRRENFAAGSKVSFVSHTGTPLPPQ